MEDGYRARAAAEKHNIAQQEAKIVGSLASMNLPSRAEFSSCSARNLTVFNGFERPRDMIVYWLCENGGKLALLGIPPEPVRPFITNSDVTSAQFSPSQPRGKGLDWSLLSENSPQRPHPPLAPPGSLSEVEMNKVGHNEYLFLGIGAFVYDGQSTLKECSSATVESSEFMDLLTHSLTGLLLEVFNSQRPPLRSHASGGTASGNANVSTVPARPETQPQGPANKAPKRSRGGDDDGDDSGNKRQQAEVICREPDKLPLACPFYKFDPVKYRPCYKFTNFRGIADVK